MGRTLTSARPPCLRASPAASASSSPGRNQALSPRSTPTTAARSCGKRESAPEAPWAVCNGASQRMKARSTSRCPTLNCGACRLELPARKLLPSTRALRFFWTARPAAAYPPSGSIRANRSGGPRIPVVATFRDAAPPSRPQSPQFQGWCSRADSTDTCAPISPTTARSFGTWIQRATIKTVNGVAAKGGSIDGGGAVIVDGVVYVGSGSGFVGSIPGNVLLAYSVDGL